MKLDKKKMISYYQSIGNDNNNDNKIVIMCIIIWYLITKNQTKLIPCKIVKNNHSFCFPLESFFDLSPLSTLSIVVNSL